MMTYIIVSTLLLQRGSAFCFLLLVIQTKTVSCPQFPQLEFICGVTQMYLANIYLDDHVEHFQLRRHPTRATCLACGGQLFFKNVGQPVCDYTQSWDVTLTVAQPNYLKTLLVNSVPWFIFISCQSDCSTVNHCFYQVRVIIVVLTKSGQSRSYNSIKALSSLIFAHSE